MAERTTAAEINETRRIFCDLVWPIWRNRFDAVDLISTEGAAGGLETRADHSGIDAFFVQKANGTLVPLASRIEWARSDNIRIAGALPARFSIRARKCVRGIWHDDTELRRLIDASTDPVSRRYLPYRTVQSFVWDRTLPLRVLFSSAVCTQTLADFLRQNRERLISGLRRTRRGDAAFISIEIAELRAVGIAVDT